jgi:hypothetical protein
MLIFIAEMCKELEIVELNSKIISDAAISHLLKRTEHLKQLDLSGCTQFNGLALADILPEQFAAKKLRWVSLYLWGHELQMVKDRLAELAP